MGCKGEEFKFIDRVKDLFSDIGSGESMGIGDDCATIPIDSTTSLVVTSDMLNEGVHFLREGISAYDLGYKSLAVNLSDVAAMGATPVASLLSVGFDKSLSGEWRGEFMEGYHSLSREFGVALLGGDTTSTSGAISINVTAIGRGKSANLKLRSSARVGQEIYVTGTLGDSGAALKMILGGVEAPRELLDAHYRPRPYVREGQWLSSQSGVGAMMDISDGVASDLRHILALSHVGAVIESIPVSDSVKRVCLEHGFSLEDIALCSGEDYRLLFTVDGERSQALVDSYGEQFGSEPFRLGRIVEGGELLIDREGELCRLNSYGYIHE